MLLIISVQSLDVEKAEIKPIADSTTPAPLTSTTTKDATTKSKDYVIDEDDDDEDDAIPDRRRG